MVETQQLLVVYNPLHECQQVLKKWRGTWKDTIEVLEVSQIQSIVGIWSGGQWVYVLRKHPGLNLLSDEECGVIGEDEEED